MKKIPMLFTMIFEEGRRGAVGIDFSTFNPVALDVLRNATEIVATRKFDGSAMMRDEGGKWWARRIIRPNKKAPECFIECTFDANTGKRVGWIPVSSPSFGWKRQFAEAIEVAEAEGVEFSPGTFELVGESIQGNPEGIVGHRLLPHGSAIIEDFPDVKELLSDAQAAHDLMEPHFKEFERNSIEGVVLWADGVPAVKIRVADFAKGWG